MGYESFHRLPYISTHAEALAKLNSTKPIKSAQLTHKLYPLGDRNYARKFAIRMADDDASVPPSHYMRCPNPKDGDIELLLFYSPVVTFHTDDTVTLFRGAWRWSASTGKFIEEVLGRYVRSTFTSKGRLIAEMHDGTKVVCAADHITLRLAPKALALIEKQGMTVLRMDRKKANEVRKRYGEFFRYAKGMLRLRAVPQEYSYYNAMMHERVVHTEYVITVTPAEMQTVVPMSTEEREWVVRGTPTKNTVTRWNVFGTPHIKPPKVSRQMRYREDDKGWEQIETRQPYNDYLVASIIFMDLIQPLKEGEDYERFHRAFMYLVFFACHNTNGIHNTHSDFVIDTRSVMGTLDQIVFKYHSGDVFYRVPAQPNTVPSTRYESWIDRETD